MAKHYAGLSRRRFLAGAVGAGGLGVLVACGNQVGLMQDAPYATNTARNLGNASVPAGNAAGGSAATPAASGSAMAGMDPPTTSQSAAAPAATATPAKDWQAMESTKKSGVSALPAGADAGHGDAGRGLIPPTF